MIVKKWEQWKSSEEVSKARVTFKVINSKVVVEFAERQGESHSWRCWSEEFPIDKLKEEELEIFCTGPTTLSIPSKEIALQDNC